MAGNFHDLDALVRSHAINSTYRPDTGSWPTKPRASIAAECLRRELAHHSPALADSRFVAVQGRQGQYTIRFPRVQEDWWPLSASLVDITKELKRILAELRKDVIA